LDTNIFSDLIRNPQGKAAKRIAKVGEDQVCTSIIVAAELLAAHAQAIAATIATAKESEFKRIRGLKVENWLA
jgi:tRNA(fMet)-specific endonuclease VapC